MGQLPLREIRRSLGRFLAIAAIVALGVGFFCGLRLTKTAMVRTLDAYAEAQQMYDFRLVSTIGFDETDAAKIADDSRVAACEGTKSADALTSTAGGASRACKFLSLPETLDLPSLKAGRLPQTADECLADGMLYSEQDLGQKIVLSEENDDDTLGQFTRREFTIVGIAKSALYINYERGSTSVGSGSLSAFVYVLPEAFDFDYDTELYLRLTDRAGEIYSDEYKAHIDDAEPWVTALAEQCADDRGTRLHDDAADAKEEADRELADAYQKLVDGQKEIEENEQKLADARKELADGEQKLADAQAEYDDGAAKLAEAREELRKQFNETVGELQSGQAEIDKNQAQLDQKRAELAAQKTQLEAQKAKLELALTQPQLPDEQRAQLEGQLAQVNAGLQQIEAAGPELDAAQQQIDAAQAELNAGSEEFGDGLEEANAEISENQKKLDEAKATLDEKNQELADAKQELADGEQQLADAKQELADGWADYYSGKAEAEQKIADAEAELADAKQQLTDGKQDIADAEVELSDGEQKLADAEQEYQDGQDALEKLENPDVFVLDRSSNIGYACFESDSDIVRGVSRVYPLFFFAVAALVCITTMTRMVDEQRTQAGVLKAMGYSNGAIVLVYFLYAGSASVLGCVVGIAAGSYFLPKMIWQGYNIMYGFTDILYAFDWPLALLSAGAYLLCALGTTWYVAHAELQRPAAELIRPKAPKAGKRILLERLPGLWNRIPFLHKVSIRNILRYKKRMIMMIIGIGGCTALLITGYGIQDSISNVVDYQYSEITRYDASVTFQHALNETERTAFAALCEEEAEEYLFVAEKSADASAGSTVKTTNVVCPASGSVEGFVDLHEKDKTPVAYPENGACVISRGLAEALQLSAGDTITLQSGTREAQLQVAAVFENYVYNYVYLTAESWAQCFGEAPAYEQAWVNFPPDADAHAASAALAGAKNVASVSLSSDFRARVATMMESLRYIVVVVVVCAAALAFIVLYNLTNINITEREREIATIKVLGFYDSETNRYVFRENIILTVLGALVGLPMGKALHAYVMSQIRIDLMCFDVRVAPGSYLLSAALTLAFGLLVNLALRRKIGAIDMAQALKSIE